MLHACLPGGCSVGSILVSLTRNPVTPSTQAFTAPHASNRADMIRVNHHYYFNQPFLRSTSCAGVGYSLVPWIALLGLFLDPKSECQTARSADSALPKRCLNRVPYSASPASHEILPVWRQSFYISIAPLLKGEPFSLSFTR